MRELRKWAWAAVVAAAAASPAAAQQGTVTSTGGRTTGSLTGGAANLAGIGLGGGANLGNSGISSGGGGGGGFGGGGGGGGTGSSAVNGGIQLQQMQTMAAPTAPTGTASSSLAASNRFAGYYANPYFQGISNTSNSAQGTQPGGFGQPLFGNATSGRGALNSGGLATTGIGGRNALGGIGGQANTQSGILIPLPSQIAYTAVMQFPTPPVAAGKIIGDVRAVIDATPMIANSKAVQIITDANNNVTLRGAVKDDDESRLIEGLVRLTPGVGSIRNELAPAAVTAGR